MEYCTNCGAAVRQGARFCTSCGVHLDTSESTHSHDSDAAEATATLDTVAYRPSAPEDEPQQAATSTDAPTDTADSSWEENWPASDETGQTAEEDEPVTTATDSDSDDAGWPAAESDPDYGVSGQPESGAAASAWSIPEDTSEQEQPGNDDGASEWEGWSPTPSPEPMVHSSLDDDALREIRELVGTLQARLDRIADPSSVSARGVDADELADQLNDWAREASGSYDLLTTIREARANPRDLDAVVRLADRADELERLVERYGTICTDAERWVARLRHREVPPDA